MSHDVVMFCGYLTTTHVRVSISEIHANAMPLIIVPAVGASPNQPCLKAVCRCRHNGDADLSWLPSVAASWKV